MMIKFSESGHPVFRAKSPLSRGTLKGKGGGKLSIHFCANEGTIETVFRTIISVNQLSIYGAVSDVWRIQDLSNKNGETPSGRTIWPMLVPTSSLTKTPTPSTDDPAQEDLLQKYQERVERLSQPDRVIRFVLMQDSWQRLTSDSTSWQKTRRILTIYRVSGLSWDSLPRDEKSTDPKGWIRRNTKMVPVLEVTTSYLQGKYGVALSVASITKAILTHGSEFLMAWISLSRTLSNNKENDNNEQKTSEMQFEDFALETNVLASASRSKAEAKPQRRTPASSSTRTVPIGERKWTDNEPEDYSPVAYPMSKQLSTLLRHGHLPREDYILEVKGISSERSCAISTLVWWKVEEYNCKRRRKQEKISTLYWSIRTRKSWFPSSSRSSRRQSHWSFITGQMY